MLPKPHIKLRGALAAADIDQQYLARKLLLSPKCVSQRMTGKYPWTLDEVYTILDLIRVPHDQMAAYFPPRGA